MLQGRREGGHGHVWPRRVGHKQRILDVVNALFAVLAILGIVVDPTTDGVGGADKYKLELIGHTSTEMLRHYQDVNLADLRAITNAI